MSEPTHTETHTQITAGKECIDSYSHLTAFIYLCMVFIHFV